MAKRVASNVPSKIYAQPDLPVGTVICWPSGRLSVDDHLKEPRVAGKSRFFVGYVIGKERGQLRVRGVDPESAALETAITVLRPTQEIKLFDGRGLVGVIRGCARRAAQHINWESERGRSTRSLLDDLPDETVGELIAEPQNPVGRLIISQALAAPRGSLLDQERRRRFHEIIVMEYVLNRPWEDFVDLFMCQADQRTPYEICADGPETQATNWLAIEYAYLPALRSPVDGARLALRYPEQDERIQAIVDPERWPPEIWNTLSEILRLPDKRQAGEQSLAAHWNARRQSTFLPTLIQALWRGCRRLPAEAAFRKTVLHLQERYPLAGARHRQEIVDAVPELAGIFQAD